MFVTQERKNQIDQILKMASNRLIELFPAVLSGGQALKVEKKSDNTIVSLADHESNRILTTGLRTISSLPIKSEESNADAHIEGGYWLIDPLDGTTRFLEGADDFAILVSYIGEGGIPQAGWMAFPARGYCFWAIEDEFGCSALRPEVSLPSLKLASSDQIGEGAAYLRVEQGRDMSRVSDSRVSSDPFHSGEAFNRFFTGNLGALILEMGRLGPWDVAAPAAIGRALGAQVLNGEGREYRFSLEDERLMIMCPTRLEEEAAELARKILIY